MSVLSQWSRINFICFSTCNPLWKSEVWIIVCFLYNKKTGRLEVCVCVCVRVSPAFPTGLLEHDHGLWRSVNRQGAGPLHGAVGPTGHAVAASGVGKPQTLKRTFKQWDKHQLLNTYFTSGCVLGWDMIKKKTHSSFSTSKSRLRSGSLRLICAPNFTDNCSLVFGVSCYQTDK